MTVLWILAILFLALFIIVPLVEKFGPEIPKESMSKMSRLIFPLMAVLLVLQLIFYLFAK